MFEDELTSTTLPSDYILMRPRGWHRSCWLWAMHPLHFGTLWGLPVKILWLLFGVSLAVLSVTGVLMYWNRYLCKRWHALTQPKEQRAKKNVEAAASS